MEKRLRLRLTLVVLSTMVSVVALGQAAQPPAQARVPPGVPRLVKFSGLLKDAAGNLLTNTVGISFAIYSEQTGGVALWQETQNVQFSQGRYTVFLGGSKSIGIPAELFASGQPRWLGVTALLPGEQEQPRVLLASVPYALKAVDADTLGGLPASAFLQANGNAAMAPPTIPPAFKGGGLMPSGAGLNPSSPTACSMYDVRFIVAGCFSGADVWAQANQAIKTLPVVNGCPTGTISLAYLYGTEKVNTTLDLTNCNSVNVIGPGKAILTIQCNLNGDCIDLRNSVGFASLNGPSVSGFTLLGNSGAHAVGVRMGDILNARLDDVDILNFSGTNSVGIWLQNGNVPNGYMEECWLSKIKLVGNTIGLRISNAGGPNNVSFGYNHFYDFFVQPGCGQTGILSDGGPNIPTLYHSTGDIFVEDQAVCSSSPPTFLSLAAGSVMLDNNINFYMEDQYGQNKAIVLEMGAGAVFTDFGFFQSWSNGNNNFMNINGTACGASRGTPCNFQASNDIFNVVGHVDFVGSTNWSPVAGFICSAKSQPGCSGSGASGWGSTSTVTAVTGPWTLFTFTITPGGTGITAGPLIVVLFPVNGINYVWRNPPAYNCQEINTTDGTNIQAVLLFQATSVTSMALQWNGTPTAGKSYTFQCTGGGR